jgi:hypothetical protein
MRRLLVGVAVSGLLSAVTAVAAWALGADPHPANGGLPGAREWPAAVAATDLAGQGPLDRGRDPRAGRAGGGGAPDGAMRRPARSAAAVNTSAGGVHARRALAATGRDHDEPRTTALARHQGKVPRFPWGASLRPTGGSGRPDIRPLLVVQGCVLGPLCSP